ncbi:dephospho-CoA kinase [Sediminispirochaeta bajacaliforniensis]|uniref:dephospho-CoA kinase n=1 Tax=Sediminispirochaeta bajacaliforniensis TaxID=148 RepID=UPI00037B0F31|nr:dephospho-CoA kinase [Sediminispirochaeta bajacaliforniensis]
MVLGLTGRYCAGKDLVASLLAERGWIVIDVDDLGHGALAARAADVVAAFGSDVGDGKDGIDRRRLGARVFGDDEALARLEAIVHPEMVREVRRRIDDVGIGGKVIVNAAILEKMGLDKLCDAILFVSAPMPLRFFRALRRDALPPQRILQRFSAQKSIDAKRLRKDVDTYTIYNVGSIRHLRKKVLRIEANLLKG